MPEPASTFHPKETDNYTSTDYGYDSVGRVNSVTNAEGYTVTYQFDPLDRRVKTTYPDGTYEQTIYSLLDAEWQRDRAGRWTRTVHNANREVRRMGSALESRIFRGKEPVKIAPLDAANDDRTSEHISPKRSRCG